MPDSSTPAGWHADPFGRHELRYWDGARWTVHVSDQGVQSTDAATSESRPAHEPERIQRQVHEQAGVEVAAGAAGGGSLFTEPVLVVNQKPKLIELTNEYSVFDANGIQLGTVRQTGQSTARKLLRLVSSVDQFLTHKMEICDTAGAVQLTVTRPAKVFKSTVIVGRPDGSEAGRIVQQNVIGKIRFSLEAGGQAVGALNAENWRAWNFQITDAAGTEVARITKTWEGLGRAIFTTADNYVLQVHRPLDEPLRSLVVASALGIDTALKQDAQGFN